MHYITKAQDFQYQNTNNITLAAKKRGGAARSALQRFAALQICALIIDRPRERIFSARGGSLQKALFFQLITGEFRFRHAHSGVVFHADAVKASMPAVFYTFGAGDEFFSFWLGEERNA